LLAAAVRRARAIAGERVMVVTAESQLAATREVAPDVELLGEPVGRNTAAAIGLAAAVLGARDPDAVLAILPADPHIADEAGLTHVLELGLAAVEREDVIATVGITPTRPETGFGYLEIEPRRAGDPVTPVLRFVEKPDRETAERYLASGTYLWNAGIFVVSARRLLAELDAQLPPTGRAVRDIAAGLVRAADVYPALPSISIDHAVMERATRVVTIPASIGWDDVGSWAALPALLGMDHSCNTITGTAIVDGTGNIVVGDDDTMIAAIGVTDLVIVKSGNAILVIPRDQAQHVRAVVEELEKRGLSKYL
jgi:mannose-1-phosphate guanylyltransferase